MIWGIVALLIFCVLLATLQIRNHLKTKRLISALAQTNVSLNEARTLLATHEKKLKQVIKSLP